MTSPTEIWALQIFMDSALTYEYLYSTQEGCLSALIEAIMRLGNETIQCVKVTSE